MNVTAIENALRAWVLAGSGLAAGEVIFAHQSGRAPEKSARIDLGDLVSPGIDELQWNFDAGQPNGQEIQFSTAGQRTFSVTVVFASKESGTGGTADARARAIACQSALRLPTVRGALNAAGVGVLDTGSVRWVPRIEGTEWLGQAILEVQLCARATASERTGYISTYEAVVTLTQ